MPDFFSQHSSEIWSFIGGLVGGGIGGSLLTLRITRQNRIGSGGSIVDQGGARAGGDIVGRDKSASGDPRR